MLPLKSSEALPKLGNSQADRDFGFGATQVTIDKSLKRKGRLARSRNVLKRDERIAQLESEDRWIEGRSPFGLPKVRVMKLALGKKKKKKAKEEDDTTPAKKK